MTPDLPTKVTILAELHLLCKATPANYQAWESFIRFNDIGLPLAWCADQDIVVLLPDAEALITNTYYNLLRALQIPNDDYKTLDQMFARAE